LFFWPDAKLIVNNAEHLIKSCFRLFPRRSSSRQINCRLKDICEIEITWLVDRTRPREHFLREDSVILSFKVDGETAVTTEPSSSKSKRITAQHVAESAGVSISAVSRAFTPGASVSATTLKKVMSAAQKLGYQPNVLAQSLMTGRTKLIGLVSNNFDNPAFMEIFDLFTRMLQDNGLRPLLANLSGNAEPEKAVAMLRQYSVDAAIIASSTVSEDFIAGCLAANIPLVHAFGKPHAPSAVHIVGADNKQGGQLAAETLQDLGYAKIAFLGGPDTASSTIDRLMGFRAGLKRRGMAPVAEVFANSYSHEQGRQLMLSLLENTSIEAVFCGDDILAMGALDACKEASKSVPGEIGILGFNDIAMASWAAYDLSTIRQPIAQIIVCAVGQAIKLVSDKGLVAKPQSFTCEAVLRGTLRKA
jgi:DNA-binding LacI/PurR family transcriptional regulator